MRILHLAVFLLLLGCAIGPPLSAAQVNTEKMRALDVNGFRAAVGGDVAYQSGNANLFEVGANLRFDYRRDARYVFLVSEVRYGEEDGEAFRDRTFAHLRYNRTLLPWLVGEAFAQVQEDGFKRLQLRTLAGAGLRVRYVDTERVKLFQGTTPMYEYENLNAAEITNHPATTSTVRWSNYVNIRLRLTEKTVLLNTLYVQPRVDDPEDIRILDEASLNVALSKHVVLSIVLDIDYDSRPPGTVEDLDIALRNGITVSF